MTRVILSAVFLLMVIPIGLLLRLVGKDVLSLKLDRSRPSYWEVRSVTDPLPQRLRRLY